MTVLLVTYSCINCTDPVDPHNFLMCTSFLFLDKDILTYKLITFVLFNNLSGFSNKSSSKDLTFILSKSAPASTTQSLLGNFEVNTVKLVLAVGFGNDEMTAKFRFSEKFQVMWTYDYCKMNVFTIHVY